MINRFRVLHSISLRRGFGTVAVGGATLLLLLLVQAPKAGADDKAKATAARCTLSDADFDTAADVHALDEYRDAIAQLLKQGDFAQLDCLADAARAGKTRFSGGAWKLRNIYIGLEEPRPGHPTQEDWSQHFELLERWQKQNPSSITVPIALAESYVRYGWDARGGGFADSVSESGWKLMAERAAKARAILEEKAELAKKCPDWYLAMQMVAQAQSWDLAQVRALFEKAAAFEPGYQYYYRTLADYLQPKWSGEEGDAAEFAEEAANRVGGDDGDILYFWIADAIVCGCQDPVYTHFSWPRAQKGFTAMEKKYGSSMLFVNSYALMATNSDDMVAADPAFKRIGDEWDKDRWGTEDSFKGQRDIAAQLAPMQAKARAFHAEAEANMKSAEGRAYRVAFDPKLAVFEQPCVSEINGDPSKFELLVEVGERGAANEAHTEKRPTGFAMCVMKGIYAAYVKKETPFPRPPKVPFRMILEIDPTTLSAAK
jgi:hypothetical protein